MNPFSRLLFYFHNRLRGLLCFWLQMSNQRLAFAMLLERAPSIGVRKTGGPWTSHWALHHQGLHSTRCEIGSWWCQTKEALDKATTTIPPNNFNNLTPRTHNRTGILRASSWKNQPTVILQNIKMWRYLGAKAWIRWFPRSPLVALESTVSFTQRVLTYQSFLRLPRVMCKSDYCMRRQLRVTQP